MIHQHSSNIILGHARTTLSSGEHAETLTFHNDLTLVLSKRTMAMFKDQTSVNDPLGNGLLTSVQLSEHDQLVIVDGKMINNYQSGFVGLMDGRAILVTPNVIQLFPSSNDALRNQNEIARLDLN